MAFPWRKTLKFKMFKNHMPLQRRSFQLSLGLLTNTPAHPVCLPPWSHLLGRGEHGCRRYCRPGLQQSPTMTKHECGSSSMIILIISDHTVIIITLYNFITASAPTGSFCMCLLTHCEPLRINTAQLPVVTAFQSLHFFS
jgi:hypothetical protein